MEDRSFKILSISGGGVKGIYTINLLKQFEEEYCIPKGKLIGDYFDMVSGTSTGGIIAMSIVNKIPMNDLLKIYIEYVPKIFHNYNHSNRIKKISSNFYYTVICPMFNGYKYNTAILEELSNRLFGNKILDDVNNITNILSYNITVDKCVIFKKSVDRLNYEIYKKILIKDILLATSAAPTFFKSHFINDKCLGGHYIDGGIFGNDPGLLSLVEAQQNFIETNEFDKCILFSVGNVENNGNYDTDKYNLSNAVLLVETMLDASDNINNLLMDKLKNTFNYEHIKIQYPNINNSTHLTSDEINKIKIDNSDPEFIDLLIKLSNIDFENYKESELIVEIFKKLKTINFPEGGLNL
jgi:patatin-like phospholipase/acyl hydrolase